LVVDNRLVNAECKAVGSMSATPLLNHLREDLKIRPVQTDKLVTYETKKQEKITLTVSRRDRHADVGDRAAVLTTLDCKNTFYSLVLTKRDREFTAISLRQKF